MLDKLNCYSTFDNLMAKERQLNFTTRYSAALIKEALYEHRLAKTTVLRKRTIEKLLALKTICSERAITQFDYRIEFRVYLFQLEQAHCNLNEECYKSNFSKI